MKGDSFRGTKVCSLGLSLEAALILVLVLSLSVPSSPTLMDNGRRLVSIDDVISYLTSLSTMFMAFLTSDLIKVCFTEKLEVFNLSFFISNNNYELEYMR